MDKLELIFKYQLELADLIAKNEKFTPTTADMCVALAHEVMELHDELGWKWWKKRDIFSPRERNARAREEVADILHFVLQIAHNLGMTPIDLCEEYLTKNMKNRKRQVDGY